MLHTHMCTPTHGASDGRRMHVHTYIHMYIYMYTHKHIHTHIHAYTHAHMHTHSASEGRRWMEEELRGQAVNITCADGALCSAMLLSPSKALAQGGGRLAGINKSMPTVIRLCRVWGLRFFYSLVYVLQFRVEAGVHERVHAHRDEIVSHGDAGDTHI